MRHQQVVPDYSAMVQTSGTVLCLVFSGWVLFRLVQAVFWLPGYLEKTQGKLYEKIEKDTKSTTKTKAKDSDAEEEDDEEADDDALAAQEEKGKDDANEREKLDGGDTGAECKKKN